MREIKFRAWDGKKIIDKLVIAQQEIDEKIVWLDDSLKGNEQDAWKYDGLMQYTGLKDKNGKEIYEGDVVDGVIYKDYSTHIGKVLYDFNGYRIVTKEKSVQLDLPEKLEIIGNIYENPELLEETK